MDWTGDIEITARDRAALLGDLEARLAEGRGFAVATLNLDHVVKLGTDPDFARAYARQTHVTADGNPIVWLERLSGRDAELIPGSELVLPVAELAGKRGVPVALFGATKEALQGAAEALSAAIPGLDVALCHAPEMGFDPDGPAGEAAIRAIEASGAGLVLLALGAPKQERFAARALQALPHAGFLSIGAGLDFLAGTQTRAPLWARRMAMEWAWRLAGSPRRLGGRYARCAAILPGLTARAIAARRTAP